MNVFLIYKRKIRNFEKQTYVLARLTLLAPDVRVALTDLLDLLSGRRVRDLAAVRLAYIGHRLDAREASLLPRPDEILNGLLDVFDVLLAVLHEIQVALDLGGQARHRRFAGLLANLLLESAEKGHLADRSVR